MEVKIDELLLELVRKGGSDLLIGSNYKPAMRRYGALMRLDDKYPTLTRQQVEQIIRHVLTDEELEEFQSELDIDFAYQVALPSGEGFARFRANAFIQRFGPSLVFRSIPRQIPTLKDLNLPAHLGPSLMDFKQGLVLVTGPTGSGKTSTLAALIDYANTQRSLNIITLEDPIEYVHTSKKSLVIQRQIGRHTDSYASALRAALREDPDIILVGELRDPETIALSITAAETGHLVLGTMNTISAAQTVGRLVNAFPPRQQSQIRMMVADSLRGVVSQQLLPRKDGNGRVVAVEILLTTSALSNLIRENKMHQVNSVIQTSLNKGMMMMDTSLMNLVKKGLVDPGEAIDRAHDKNSFVEKVYAAGG